MNDSIELPFRFDPVRLQRDLGAIESGDWIDHFVEQNYEGEWSVIPLRGPAGAEHPVMMIYSDPTCSEFADTPFLRSAPYFSEVLEQLHCSLQAARLMKLTPGSRIKEHTDLDLSAEEGVARLHIPIQTNDGVDFRLNGRRLVLEEGACWYLRLCDPHSIENRGNADRVHLVVDVEVNDWLKELLEYASANRSTQ